jgi:hypothetical protein
VKIHQTSNQFFKQTFPIFSYVRTEENPLSRFLPAKLLVPQLVKKIPILNDPPRFVKNFKVA